MKKIEQVFREILYQALEKKNMVMTQLELAKDLGFSLSTVNLALKRLDKVGAVRIGRMNFKIMDVIKMLYLWASLRNLDRDIAYSTRVEMPARDIEKSMPEAVYGAYSAYKLKFKDVPADYSEVYVYAEENTLEEIKRRFPQVKSRTKANLFILKADDNMKKYGQTGTIAQIFVELWNLREWYAREFLNALEIRIKNMLKNSGDRRDG